MLISVISQLNARETTYGERWKFAEKWRRLAVAQYCCHSHTLSPATDSIALSINSRQKGSTKMIFFLKKKNQSKNNITDLKSCDVARNGARNLFFSIIER